jgi:hypothetical protein
MLRLPMPMVGGTPSLDSHGELYGPAIASSATTRGYCIGESVHRPYKQRLWPSPSGVVAAIPWRMETPAIRIQLGPVAAFLTRLVDQLKPQIIDLQVRLEQTNGDVAIPSTGRASTCSCNRAKARSTGSPSPVPAYHRSVDW